MKKNLLKLVGVLGVASVFALTSCNVTINNGDNQGSGDNTKTSTVVEDDFKYKIDASSYNKAIEYLKEDDVTIHAFCYNDEKKTEKLSMEIKIEKDGNNVKLFTSTTIGTNKEDQLYYCVLDGENERQFELGPDNAYIETTTGVPYEKVIPSAHLGEIYSSLKYDEKTKSYKVSDFEANIVTGDVTVKQKLDVELKFEDKKLIYIESKATLESGGKNYVSITTTEIAYGNSAFVLPAEVEVLLKK